MALFRAGYFRTGLFRPGFFGALVAGPLVLPLDADEMVARWLIGIVKPALASAGLTSVRVWTDNIPDPNTNDAPGTDSRFPGVLIRLHDSSDRVGASAARLMTWSEYQIQVIDKGGSFQPMSPVKALIDQTIEATRGGITSDGRHYVSKAYRRSAIRYTEQSEATGNRYNHQGGIYRLMHYTMPGGNA